QLAQFLYEVCNISHVAFLVVSSSAAVRLRLAPARHATAFLSSFVNRRFTLLLFVCLSGPLAKADGNCKLFQPFSAFALITRASCDAGVLINTTSFVAGAFNRPSSVARNTSRLGRSARATIAACSRRWLFK